MGISTRATTHSSTAQPSTGCPGCQCSHAFGRAKTLISSHPLAHVGWEWSMGFVIASDIAQFLCSSQGRRSFVPLVEFDRVARRSGQGPPPRLAATDAGVDWIDPAAPLSWPSRTSFSGASRLRSWHPPDIVTERVWAKMTSVDSGFRAAGQGSKLASRAST